MLRASRLRKRTLQHKVLGAPFDQQAGRDAMTRDQVQSVHDDIAYMKALAQEGRRAPLLGGAILITAGLVFGLASLVAYGIDSGILNVPPVAYAFLWGGAMLVFLVI